MGVDEGRLGNSTDKGVRYQPIGLLYDLFWALEDKQSPLDQPNGLLNVLLWALDDVRSPFYQPDGLLKFGYVCTRVE